MFSTAPVYSKQKYSSSEKKEMFGWCNIYLVHQNETTLVKAVKTSKNYSSAVQCFCGEPLLTCYTLSKQSRFFLTIPNFCFSFSMEFYDGPSVSRNPL